ncbi:MAG: TAXI family TRAP transporter solute-binding subunit [Deltaproteobacteria bacterium]|nr:TAXI family TRAP transporter solute-binding subunit [Deltaproteobacteria bacterium]
MKKTIIIAALMCFAAVITAGLLPSRLDAKTRFATIGTGGITGVYYPTGGAISKMINKKRKVYGVRCTVESTAGSVFNVNAVMSGDLDFGIVQSDRQYQAVNGKAEWKDAGPQDLRAIFSIHPEAVTLVAAQDAGIKSINDLRGKRVNIGNPGSGQRQNVIDALSAAGIDYEKDLHAEQVKASEAAGLLQDGRIDAFFYTVGHPSGAIKEATAGNRKVRIIPITDTATLLDRYPYYAPAVIPIKFYPRADNKTDIATFGVKATFVTSSRVPDEMVYAITKEVFENLDQFKKLHPAYEVLTPEGMLQGLSAPLHPGAIKYYKEVGLLK